MKKFAFLLVFTVFLTAFSMVTAHVAFADPPPTTCFGTITTPGTQCSQNSSDPAQTCCQALNLVCVTLPHAATGTCRTCTQTHLQNCQVDVFTSPTSCCASGYTCSTAMSTSGQAQCLLYSEITQPTVSVKNPCPTGPNGVIASCPTALGDIPTDPGGFVQTLFRIILSLSGGVALLIIVNSGFRLAVSTGNPEKVQQARETLISAIVGLVFILFSLTILQIIGVDILGLGTRGGELFFH